MAYSLRAVSGMRGQALWRLNGASINQSISLSLSRTHARTQRTRTHSPRARAPQGRNLCSLQAFAKSFFKSTADPGTFPGYQVVGNVVALAAQRKMHKCQCHTPKLLASSFQLPAYCVLVLFLCLACWVTQRLEAPAPSAKRSSLRS